MIKLTKTELRDQQVKLVQLQKYLPTLQLKKALLQIEVNQTQHEIEHLVLEFNEIESQIRDYSPLFSDRDAIDLFSSVKIAQVHKTIENIAGIEIPVFGKIDFQDESYFMFDAPIWMESAVLGVKKMLILREKVEIAKEKKRALEKEFREVSIRVNLFEKIMIPRALENIKKIKIFLGDQQLAAVSQAKVSKKKILLREANNDH